MTYFDKRASGGNSGLPLLAMMTLMALTSSALTAPAAAADFASSIALSSLDGTTGFKLGASAGQGTGNSVTSAGDINGDGFEDFIIGAPASTSVRGRVFVVFGTAVDQPSSADLSALDGTTGFRIVGGFDLTGFSAAGAGDINGDGTDDLIIGAPYASTGGYAYVVFGNSAGFASSISTASLNGSNGFRLVGNNAPTFGHAGQSVAAAGDVNGDGIDDVIIGDPGDDSDAEDAGAAYVVFGSAAGFASSVDLSSLDGTTGFRLDSITANEAAGTSVAGVGDINEDGNADIIVGAPGNAAVPTLTGGAYVVFGSSTGFAAEIDLSALAGADGFRLNGAAVGDFVGHSAAGAGDVNGDGFKDMLVGAPGADPGGLAGAGTAYVVMGKASTFASAVDLGAVRCCRLPLNGAAVGDSAGQSVASAGDLNADGFADIAVGAPAALSTGASYVVLGKSIAFSSSINVSTLNGTTGFRLDGVTASDLTGLSGSSVGDFNRDGPTDLAIGAPAASDNRGLVYVLHGRLPTAAAVRGGGAADQYISGGAFADSLSGRGGDDLLEGRAGADALSGATGTDTATYQHAAAGVRANLASPSANTNEAAGDTYSLVENLTGSELAEP